MIPGIVAQGRGITGGGGGPPPADPYPDVIIADTPIRYLRLEETSGTAIAEAMGGANWTLAGTVTLGITGAVDNGVKFTSGGISSPLNAVPQDTTAGFSIEFWIKLFTADSSVNSYIVSRSNTFEVLLGFGGANTVSVFRQSAPSLASSSLPIAVARDDAWHHIVITHDGTTIRGYRDGVEVNTLGHSATITLDTSCTLGRTTSASNPFLGGIDEAAWYDYVLTPTQVANHYAAR